MGYNNPIAEANSTDEYAACEQLCSVFRLLYFTVHLTVSIIFALITRNIVIKLFDKTRRLYLRRRRGTSRCYIYGSRSVARWHYA